MKSFPAKLAHERFVSRVDARVRVEGGAAVESFPTLVTLVRFFLSKRKRRGISITQENFASDTNIEERGNVILGKLRGCFWVNVAVEPQEELKHNKRISMTLAKIIIYV